MMWPATSPTVISRFMVALCLFVPSAGAAAQQAATAEDTAETAAVRAVIDRLFDGMRERDMAKLGSAFHAEARLHGLDADGGVRITPAADFIAGIARAPEGMLLDEVLGDVEIRIDGPLASAWTYYDFFAGDNFSHCGYNAFQLLKTAGEWKVVAITDSRRREGCRQQRRAEEPPIQEAELLRRTGALIDSLAAADAFAGVVIIARNGRPVWERAVGHADREAREPNSMATAFNIGSINKIFTQIAIMQLAAAGKLELDARLADAWPDYPNADVAQRVTVRQLLRHSSGIGGNIFAAPTGGRRSDVRHNRDFLQLFVDAPLQFEPGQRQQYSNAGYVVLGMLIERLSGQDYYDYVRQHIYTPAGMTATAHHAADSLPSHAAVGYTRGDAPGTPTPQDPASTRDTRSPWVRNTSTLPGRGSAAGGGYSTAHDLMAFVQALREQRIPNAPPPGVGIAGGAPGLNAAVEGDLPGGYDIIVLANMSPPAAEQVAGRIRRMLGATN
ncbi:hypothetical protein BH23GEM9_BH23GEM9_07740 [soil metagenome]